MSVLRVIALSYYLASGQFDADKADNGPGVSDKVLDGWRQHLPCCSKPPPVIREDYQYYIGVGAYKLHINEETWNHARRTCVTEGGNLAVVNSKAEALVLKTIFEKTKVARGEELNEEAFIGIHDMFKQGDWVTVYGRPLGSTGFVDWNTTVNFETGKHCGTLLLDGPMNTYACKAELPYFCEIPFS